MKILRLIRMFIINLFKKSIPIEKEDPVKETQTEHTDSSIMKEYKSIDDELIKIDKKYVDYLIKSLKIDFITYKKHIDNNVPILENWFWQPSLDWNTIKISKTANGSTSIISMNFNIDEGKFQRNRESDYIEIKINGRTIKSGITDTNLIKVISMYYFVRKMKDKKATLKELSDGYETMKAAIGSDIERDNKLEELLK